MGRACHANGAAGMGQADRGHTSPTLIWKMICDSWRSARVSMTFGF